MILADTSVWVNHLRRGDHALARLLQAENIGLHPFIFGELAAGNLRNRERVLAYFASLPQLPIAPENEVHHLLASRRLWGSGLGWIDLHILTAAKLSGWRLYTADHAMNEAAGRLEIQCVSLL
ncbi:MAG TPA: PIN domain-containing protein [Bryobacteraceae bacterium]|jgi:hypothetical protein